MPLMKCEINGQSGWKFGESGTCYSGEKGKEKAVKQAVAIGGGKYPEDIVDEDKEMIERLEKDFEEEKKKLNKKDSVQRFDVFEITEQNMIEPFRKTPEGYLKGRAIVTNTGIFNYIQSDGTVLRELRTPEDIGKQETLDSLIMQVMTDNHPKSDIAPNGVNADNVKQLQVGFTGENVRFDGHVTSIPITITDAKTVQEVEQNGKVSLSCGYHADLEMKSGYAYGNNQYDAIQRNIRYNHIAIVDRGRAGDLAKIKLRMDSLDAIYINEDSSVAGKTNQKEKKMAKIKLNDNVEFEVDARVEEEFNIIKKDNEDLKNKVKEKEGDISKLQADHDSLKDQLDTAKKELPEQIKREIKERIALVDYAVKQGIEVKDEMENKQIQKAVILKAFPEAKLEDKDEIYIQARYDSAVDVLTEKISQENKSKVFTPPKKDEKKEDAEIVRKRRMSNEWKLNSEQAQRYRQGRADEDILKVLDQEV